MTSSRRGSLVVALVALCVAATAAVGVVVIANDGGAAAPATADSAVGRGEVIFQAGRDAAGRPIPRTIDGNGGGMMGGGMLARGGCANCHGRDGHGRSTMMFTAPDITYANVTDPEGMVAPDGTREESYTDTGLRAAVAHGVDPEGERLDWPMPRWQLTDGEWDDLLAYLKTLH
jgi:cytochrome c oxidase subunit II